MELPEGWYRSQNLQPGLEWVRTDYATVVTLNPTYGRRVYVAFPSMGLQLPSIGTYATPLAAMAALDREYPMEKQHGEK